MRLVALRNSAARRVVTWRLGLILAATVLVLAGCGPEAFKGTKKAPDEFDPGPGSGDNSAGRLLKL